MSRIEELINRLCPDGVEFKKLGKTVIISRGVRVVKRELDDNKGYPVFQNSLTPMGFYKEYNCNPNTTFIISAGSAGEIGYNNYHFWAADDCFIINVNEETICNKFIYYFLLTQKHIILSKVRKASVPRISRSVIENISIPIPPLEIQQEIVRILDNFTELTNELTNELTARKKQYEYYRDKLLTFDKDDDKVKWMKLGEICKVYDGVHQTPKYQSSGIPFISVENINNIYGSKKIYQ